MNAEVLLGGRTRFRIMEALVEAKQPVTAHQIALSKGLDPSATYRCLAEFSDFGIVASETKTRNQTVYKLSKSTGKLAAEFLRALTKNRSESDDMEEWFSSKTQAERMSNIIRVNKEKIASSPFVRGAERKSVKELMSKRTSEELSVLIQSSEIAFNELFETNENGVFVLKV